MYRFFLPPNNNSTSVIESSNSAMNPAATVGLVIGVIIVMGGAIYCCWKQYRCWCSAETSTANPIQATTERGGIHTVELRDGTGNNFAIHRTYPDGSTLVLPVEPEESEAIKGPF